MDNKNSKSIDKKANSLAEINKRIDSLSKSIEVTTEDNYVAILLRNQSPQYHRRFAAWAKNTLEKDNHFENMINALLSKYSLDILKGSSEFSDDFVRGQASGLLFLWEELQRLSNVDAFNNKEKE